MASCGSCHQALWPSAFAAPGLQPALCLHRQRSSIAACPLPAHSPLLLGHSSLPFASLQTLKTPKTPKTLHRRCGTCFVIALCYWGIQACRYQASNVSNSVHVSRALLYHACAFEANDASAADCGLSGQSLATFGTNEAWIAAAISTGDMRIRRSWMSWGASQYFILVASPQWRHEYSPLSIIIPLLWMKYI